MRVLITGGAGFIGSHLVDRLIKEGHKTIVADDLSRGKLKNVNAKADFEKIDITSKKFKNLVKKFKPDVIFHFAAQSSITKSIESPKKDIAINLLATQGLLDTAKEVKVNKVIFASSAAVYARSTNLPIAEENPKEPVSLYGVSKLCSEYLLRNYHKIHNLSYASLRFANVYGPRQDMSAEGGVVAIFIDKILKTDKAVIFGDGTQTRDFIYVSDVVKACLLSLRNDVLGEFNISTAKETSILSLYKKLIKLSNVKVSRKFEKCQFPEAKRSSLSFKKFRNACNWEPKVDLDQGLKLAFAYFKKIQNSLAEQN